jgi:hypothetical protein
VYYSTLKWRLVLLYMLTIDVNNFFSSGYRLSNFCYPLPPMGQKIFIWFGFWKFPHWQCCVYADVPHELKDEFPCFEGYASPQRGSQYS